MYALNLNEEKRILSACIANKFTPASMPRVDELPEGDLNDYLFVDGEYVYSPVPAPEPVPPTPEQRVAELRNWFDHDYRMYNEKLQRFEALEIAEIIHDEFRGKDYENLHQLYVEAEVVRAEINELENEADE